MCELKKMESYLRVNLLGLGPRLKKKIIYRAAVSHRLSNTVLPYVGKTLNSYTKEKFRSCALRRGYVYSSGPYY